MLKTLEKYELLNSIPKFENERIINAGKYLLSLYEEVREEIGRKDLMKKFGGDYFFKILEDIGVS